MLKKTRKVKTPKRFTEEEDVLLAQCVGSAERIDWNKIASQFKGRTSRQVRERWNLYLNPNINVLPWTDAEDDLLIEKINLLGCSWSRLNSFFPGRTQMSIKNRWNSHLKRIVEKNSKGLYEIKDVQTKKNQQIRVAKQIQRHKTAMNVLMKTIKDTKKPESNVLDEEIGEISLFQDDPNKTKTTPDKQKSIKEEQPLIKFAPDSIFFEENPDIGFEKGKDETCA